MTKKTDATPAPDKPMARPIPLDITTDAWARALDDLRGRLVRAITNARDGSVEAGRISRLVADIRALDLVEPMRVPAPVEPVQPDPPDVAERKAAASDRAAMQVLNAKVARKESIDAARAEE
jgi:hypothetical protein